MNRLYDTKLTLRELRLLDGECEEQTQAVVDHAKEDDRIASTLDGASDAVKQFVCDAVREARTEGRLVFYHRSLRHGKYSGKAAGYATRTRSSRSGRRGDPNYSKPLSFSGVELAHRFVTVTGSAVLGDSREFFEEAQPYLAQALEGIDAEIPEQITGYPPRYKRHFERHCKKCEWVGLEHEMGTSLTLMCDGHYPSTCPSCGAKNAAFGADIVERTGNWKVLPVKEQKGTE